MSEMNGKEPNGDTPLWFRLTIRYGLWAAVAVGLLWVLVGDVRAGQKDASREHAEMAVTLSRLEWYAWRTCLNTADTEVERAGCALPEHAR